MTKQSMIGGKILENQLQRIGVLGVNDTISNHPAFDAKYKVCELFMFTNPGSCLYSSCLFVSPMLLLDAKYSCSVWANHGDSISTQYSGTPALKGDFVR